MVRFALILSLAGCSSLLGIGDLEGPPDGGPTPPSDGPPGPAVDCKAQRVVHIVAGGGGLAWFTLIWPVPGVIKSFDMTFAYDNPALAKNLTTDLSHQLFVRAPNVANGVAVWEGKGTAPQPSIFLAGTNETHTPSPSSTVTSGGLGLLAAAGAMQVSTLAPAVPVLAFERSTPYGAAPGAPAVTQAANVDVAIAILESQSGMANAAELRPSSAQLARYFSMGAPTTVVDLGTKLAFTANALKQGLVGSVMIPAFNDDPHGAFADGSATVRANQLAIMLDAFYADLGTGNEASCGDGGRFLSLADNVVLMVTGDTMKNPYVSGGWPDGTPGNSNVMYLRSNGFTKPGWFGELQPGGIRLFFDPTTGLSGSGDAAADTNAAFAGALYAIARGNRMQILPYTSAPFDGLVLGSD